MNADADVKTGEEEAKADASIIDPKYRDKYKNKPKDWLSQFIDGIVVETEIKTKTVKAEDGTESQVEVPGKSSVNLDKLFNLATANGIDARGRYFDQVERKNAAGRLRMTIGNMLRAAARKRHGLFDIGGDWHDADADFIGDKPKTQNPDGSKIAVAKPAEPEAEAA